MERGSPENQWRYFSGPEDSSWLEIHTIAQLTQRPAHWIEMHMYSTAKVVV
jgi:hypothetical protein